MSNKHDMSDHVSKVDNHFLKQFCSTYNIGPEYKPTVPQPDHRITDCPDGYIGLYTRHFESSNIRIPFSNFFLDFLKHYKLNISQLSPLGAMKVTHFEIMCRALGGEPSLPLFRQFYGLAWNGDWYTVRQRRNLAICCISCVPTSMPPWKDSFFWVSAEAIPFKMGWRHHDDEPSNVIPPHTEHFDQKLYQLLVYHPTCLQQQGFPEHVLILAGLSRNWPHLNAEPVIMDGDKEMDLLKYIKETGVGNAGVVKFTSRSLAEHEDHILERTKGICYEGTGSSGGNVEIHMSTLIAKGKGPETVSEPASSSKKRDNVVVITIDDSSDETTPQTHVEEAPVSSAGNKRRRGKQIVFTDESSSDHYEVGQTSAGQESVPEVVTRWYEKKSQMEARLRDRISRYRLKMTWQHQKIRKLGKKVRKLKKSSNFDKGREAIRMQAKVVEALKKELEEARDTQEKLKQESATAAREKEGWMQERVSLEKSLERVWSERQWLIEEGFEYVIKKLHQSREFLEPLAAVESNIWLAGAHDGLVEGYANCKAGVALEHNRLFKPKAEGELTKAADELKNIQYPYVVALSKYRDRTLDELKALEPDMGMEDEGVGCSKKVGKPV
ncbi:hypothetical protein HanOQP8_Chr16g0629121 [Helianthus annuus]|nr:hypothetical protein HanIR_Chr16g0830461 [Helianthus annuus]KAJ0461605.1 hypothetical protein HanHA89_Chr16g0674191 [Helianthus annuus]KAJ0645900.1 hypothetical protein HanOQP8_Chr16g0629121 [Helianthus annuus]KAJ0822500.1 hypothetical protein HanPSC8_Chr16g0732801 [Helianthus annuus]